MELYGNKTLRFFWNEYKLEKYLSYNLYYKLPLLEAVKEENYSFNSFCTIHKEFTLNNFIFFTSNVDKVEKFELMFKD